MPGNSLLWFRNDLRLHDNPVLRRALETSEAILPVYCIDPQQFRQLALGFPKCGAHRATFLRQCLDDLRTRLRSIGGDLLVVRGQPATVLAELVRTYDIDAVYAQRLITHEERQDEAAVRDAVAAFNCRLKLNWSHLLYHPDDIAFAPEQTPATFKTFRKWLRKKGRPRQPLPTPKAWPSLTGPDYGPTPELPEAGAPAYPGGETAARQRLQYYLFDSELLTRYKWTRNRSLGDDYSSKFSPYLAHGCLSPRDIYHAVKQYERSVKKNISTYWLGFELKWREFFQYLAMKHGNRIFRPGGIKARPADWRADRDLFQRWCTGRTGIPFIDAHMRQLNRTGFLSNRGRVNCASFLSHDYRIDWTWGAAYFESRLIDYDVCSNWLNWNFQATELRYTNPIWQHRKYDREGAYVKNWLPALAALPPPLLYAPFLMSEEDQHRYGVLLDRDYPRPAIIREQWDWVLRRLRKELGAAGQQPD